MAGSRRRGPEVSRFLCILLFLVGQSKRVNIIIHHWRIGPITKCYSLKFIDTLTRFVIQITNSERFALE